MENNIFLKILSYCLNGILAFFAIFKSITGGSKTKKINNINTANSMYDYMVERIVAVEQQFKGFAEVMGDKLGEFKHSQVIKDLQIWALGNGYNFDLNEWSAKITAFVESTKKVNYTEQSVKDSEQSVKDTANKNQNTGVIMR